MIETANEEWRDIPGYEGLYQASSLGRICALRFRNGTCDKLLPEPRIIRQTSRGDYLRVGLCHKAFDVHVLVLKAFGPPQPPGTESGHDDGNGKNNCAANLKWVTKSGNAKDRDRHGTQQRGESCYNAKLTVADVKNIRAAYRPRSKDANSKTLAADYGMSPGTIQKIVARKAWSHV